VIDNHLDTRTPVVLKGDQLLPVARPGVHAVVPHEPAAEQLVANYRGREPAAGDQTERAVVSQLHSDLLVIRAIGDVSDSSNDATVPAQATPSGEPGGAQRRAALLEGA
jgi:hypothetical protein